MPLYDQPRNQVSPSDFIHIDSPEAPSFGEALGAGFRTENLVGDALRDERAPNAALQTEAEYVGSFGVQPKSTFNAWDQIDGTPYEEYWQVFAGARSQQEVDAIRKDIDSQRQDRAILDRAGGRGVAAAMIAGLVDLPTLVPGAAAVRSANLGRSVTQNALRTSAAASAEAVAVEGILHASQATRTAEESYFAVGGSIILGGILGGGVGAALSRSEAGREAFDNASRWLDGEDVKGGVGLDQEVRKAEGLSADVVAIYPSREDFEIEDSAAQGAVNLTPSGTTFGITAMKAQSPVAQKTMLELASTPFAVRGVDRHGMEPAAEVAQEVLYDRARISMAKTFRGMYAKYRKRQGISWIEGAIGQVGDGNLTRKQFNERVASSLRREDVDEIPEIAEAAQQLRRDVIEPLKEKAIAVGLLPKDVTTKFAASYFTRMWDADKIIRRSDEFEFRLTKHFQADFRGLRKDNAEGFNLSDADLDFYAGAAARDVMRTLTDKGRVPGNYGVTVKARGPMKERTLNVQDVDFEDFLINDAEYVLDRYARVMSADITLKERFGSVDMAQQLEDIANDYDKIIRREKDKKKRAKLHKEKLRVLERTEALRDMMRGNYMIGEKSGMPYRVIQSAMSYNFIRLLGQMVLSAVPDIPRAVMQNGLTPFMNGAMRPLMTNTKGFMLQAEKARELAGISEGLLGTRGMRIADITDPVGNQTPVENAIQGMSSAAGTLSGMNMWNDFFKGIATQTTTNRLRRLGNSKQDKAFLQRLKVNRRDAEAIKAEMETHGVDGAGVFDPGWENWKPRNREIYAQILRADADNTIVTPGLGDKVPGAEHHYWLKPALQFKNFAIAAHTRVMISGLQEDKARFLMSSITMTSMGMFVYWAKAQSSGRELPDDASVWIAEGIDRSGVFPLVMEVNNWLEAAGSPVGVYNILTMGRHEASRYAQRNVMGKIAGPTAGLGKDMAVVLGGLLRLADPTIEQEDRSLTKSDIKAARRLIPFGRHPGFKEWLDWYAVPNITEGME